MRLVPVLVAVVLLAGCASTVRGVPVGPPAAPPPSDQLVFRVEVAGGFVPSTSYATGRPRLSVYGDGTAYVAVDRNPASAGTPVELMRAGVPREIVRRALAAASDRGLFAGGDDLGDPGITDSPTTRVTIRPGAAPARSVSAYALEYAEGDDNLTTEQRTKRRAMRTLIRTVDDAVVRNGNAGTWPPDRIDVTELDVRTRTGNPQAWPGPPPGTVLKQTDRGRCGVLTGAVAKQVFATALARGNLDWREGTVVRPLAIRALLPGEVGCRR